MCASIAFARVQDVQNISEHGTRQRPRPAWELALLALLYVGYSGARLLANADVAIAIPNAHRLLAVEAALHIDIERSANSWLMSVPGLPLLSSYWYSALHYVLTPALLVWVYRAHAGHYRRVRNVLTVGTALGLLGFVLVPMAPPRMLPGYVDTLATTAANGWWGSDASAPRGLGGLTNELAAMPSLHVGWALWCTWVVCLCTRTTWARLTAVAYSTGTVLVVIATANHYVLDAVAGAAVIAVAIATVPPRAGIARAVPHQRVRHVAGGPEPFWPAGTVSIPTRGAVVPRAFAADRCSGLRQGHPGGAAGGALRHRAHLQR
jgi:PAP2 superfamily protein